MIRRRVPIAALTLTAAFLLLTGCSNQPAGLLAPPIAAAPSGASSPQDREPPGKVSVRINWLERTNQPRSGKHPVRSVSMVDDSVGYGLGLPRDGNALLTTRDGGATWQPLGALPDDGQPWRNEYGREAGSVSFPDAQAGWAVSSSGHLLRTTDGGKQWQSAALPPGATVAVAVRFATPQKGCVQVADERMTVWWTRDGGAAWEKAQGSGGLVGCARRLAATFSANPDDDNLALLEARPEGLVWLIWIHGFPDTTSVSTDDGQHWQEYRWPERLSFRQISFGTEKTGLALIWDGRLLRTRDGGGTWQETE